MKKFFLVLFLGFFLFSCNNEIDENINSGSNENQNLENNEEVANLKITAELEPDFEVNYLTLDLNLTFNNGYEFLYLQDFIKENDLKSRNEVFINYKNDLENKKFEILKEFPEIEKNLDDSEEKIDGITFVAMFQAFTDLKTEEKFGNKISLKIDGNYNSDFKGNLYNFPFYNYYGQIQQEPMNYNEILLAKNTGKNTYSIEKTENNFINFILEKALMTGYIGTSNHTFKKIPEKIFIDFASVSEIYRKYPREENSINLGINYGENNNIQIEKIEYDGKNIDLNDEEFYICSENSGKNCNLDLEKILENEEIKNITIYTKNIK